MRTGGGAVDQAAEARPRLALDVLSPPLHQQSVLFLSVLASSNNTKTVRRVTEKSSLYAPPAEPQVTPQVAALVARALEVQQAALHEPRHLETDARVDELVKMAARVLEGERVRVDEVLGDEEVDFGGEAGEGPFRPSITRLLGRVFGWRWFLAFCRCPRGWGPPGGPLGEEGW